MTVDLTAITTPFGLLDRETQEALKAHGGPWEYFGPGGDWRDWMNTQAWFLELAYRVKPAPPKPREFWLTINSKGQRYFYEQPVRDDDHEVIHVREVLPE